MIYDFQHTMYLILFYLFGRYNYRYGQLHVYPFYFVYSFWAFINWKTKQPIVKKKKPGALQ